jgi:hypothetical protein
VGMVSLVPRRLLNLRRSILDVENCPPWYAALVKPERYRQCVEIWKPAWHAEVWRRLERGQSPDSVLEFMTGPEMQAIVADEGFTEVERPIVNEIITEAVTEAITEWEKIRG